MKRKIDIGIQFVLGLFLVAVGLNKFLNFMSMPEMSDEAQSLMQAMVESGYIMPMVGVTEILCGVLLLIRVWSALAVVLLAPLSVNVVLFHLALDPATIGMAAFLAVANVYLISVYWPKYQPLLRPKS